MPRPSQTVFVVYTEWNRGYDLEGGATVEGVARTRVGADVIKAAAIAGYREVNPRLIPYGDGEGETEDDWAYDVHVEEQEMQP